MMHQKGTFGGEYSKNRFFIMCVTHKTELSGPFGSAYEDFTCPVSGASVMPNFDHPGKKLDHNF
jgi:hypothetical protein